MKVESERLLKGVAKKPLPFRGGVGVELSANMA